LLGLDLASLPASIIQYTRAPYELVLVETFHRRHTGLLRRIRIAPDRHVSFYSASSEQRFSAGCNQGLREAKGDYVVFPNIPLWSHMLARRLVRPAIHDATVGWWARRRTTPAPQQVPGLWQRPLQAARFCRVAATRIAGKNAESARVTGFCLLATRALLDAVGALTRVFGAGFLEGDDLALQRVFAESDDSVNWEGIQ